MQRSAPICTLSDLPDGESRGVDIDGLSLLLVRQGDQIFAYHNICPHVGSPLNWMPDRFLNRDKTLIQCSTHGAQFDIATGACVFGPCPGQSLRAVDVKLQDGQIYLSA